MAVVADASFAGGESLPAAPPGTRLRRVRYRTCPGSDLVLSVLRDVGGARLDGAGVPSDGWWRVRCSGLPDRTLRLSRGTASLTQLLTRYGFQDASGCVNHRDARLEYEPVGQPLAHGPLHVPAHLEDATGVPQFYPRSGVCWYAALCWASFGNERVRAFLQRHFPEDLRALCDQCLFSRDRAEDLRRALWHRYGVGDDVSRPPEEDGQNGFGQFAVLCARLKIPMLRFRETGGELVGLSPRVSANDGSTSTLRAPVGDEEHLLVLRFIRGDHSGRFPIHRRVTHQNRRYRLLALYMGQSKCGHQIALMAPTASWRDWVIGDADCHKDGIGPTFVHFEGDEWTRQWWQAWRSLVPVTKYSGGQFCPLSPHNVGDASLDRYRATSAVGNNNIDVLYYYEG